MKNNEEFRQFQRDHVRLNKTRYDELNQHMQALDSYLSNNHHGFRKTERQGSHALGTIIRPTTDDAKADADILVLVKTHSGDCKTYVPDLAETLKASDLYRDKIVAKTRCVTVQYNEASKCEVDLVPCIERDGRFYVCPSDGKDFEETDGTGYREWFNDKNRATAGNLKRIVRLLKHARDHREMFECPSIVLTTLAAQTISDKDQETEAFSTQADTLVTVLSRMSKKLDETPYPPDIKNPALPSEIFDPHWTKSEYERFRTTIRQMAQEADAALRETDKEKSVTKWQRVCGEKFTEASNASNRGGASNNRDTGPSPIIAPAASFAPRRTEARPFG